MGCLPDLAYVSTFDIVETNAGIDRHVAEQVVELRRDFAGVSRSSCSCSTSDSRSLIPAFFCANLACRSEMSCGSLRTSSLND